MSLLRPSGQGTEFTDGCPAPEWRGGAGQGGSALYGFAPTGGVRRRYGGMPVGPTAITFLVDTPVRTAEATAEVRPAEPAAPR